MVSYSIKALGENFREEQRFLLVSIETTSDQEGREFLSSVHFSEPSSAARRTGGPVQKKKKKKPQPSSSLRCGACAPLIPVGMRLTRRWEFLGRTAAGEGSSLHCHVPQGAQLAGGLPAAQHRPDGESSRVGMVQRGRGWKKGKIVKEKCAVLCQN